MPKACSTGLRMRVVAAVRASETCRAAAASLGVAPSAAGKWNRAFSRSRSMSLARISGFLGFAIDPHGEWSRKQARTRPWIRARAMPRVPFR